MAWHGSYENIYTQIAARIKIVGTASEMRGKKEIKSATYQLNPS